MATVYLNTFHKFAIPQLLCSRTHLLRRALEQLSSFLVESSYFHSSCHLVIDLLMQKTAGYCTLPCTHWLQSFIFLAYSRTFVGKDSWETAPCLVQNRYIYSFSYCSLESMSQWTAGHLPSYLLENSYIHSFC